MIGEVISFSRMKGWGFIKPVPDDGAADILVFRTALANARWLCAGEVVQFKVGEHNGKPCAVNVFVERNGGRDE
jgi:cold shock CspA family protein